MLFVATPLNCALRAQQLPARTPLITRTVCSISTTGSSTLIEHYSGSLTRDGQWLFTIAESGELVRYRVSDLSKELIDTPAHPRLTWVDSQTDAVFVFLGSDPDNKTRKLHAELHCFENAERAMRWQPAWSRQNVPIARGGIYWVPGTKKFALFQYRIEGIGETEIVWLNQTGNEVGSCNVPGMLIGIDTAENGIEAYFVTRSGNTKIASFSTTAGQGNVGQTTDLFYSQNLRSASTFSPPGRWAIGARMYRLDALRPGDVRKLVVDGMSRPQFFAYQDLAYSIRDPQYLRCLASSYGRLHNLGILSAAEVDTNFEIVDPQIGCVGGARYYPACIVNRASTLLQFPQGHQIIDATKHRDSWTFVTCSRQHKKMMLHVSTLKAD